jgi:hypothetical protein
VASEQLESSLDGELTVDQQVALDAHLRWCVVCRDRFDDLCSIGEAMRVRHRTTVGSDAVSIDLSAMRSSVLERVKAEHEQSWPVRVGRAFADRRLLWPALGASVAVGVCLLLASGVLSALAEVEERESLAALIETLAHPGSDENPLVFDGHGSMAEGRVSMPRALDPALVLNGVMDDDVAFAVSAVVTREGRIATPELLMSERASGRRRQGAAELDVDAPAVMDAVKRSRFTPATGAQGPVAVNVVWLVTRTTVKAGLEAAPVKRLRPVVPTRPVVVPEPATGSLTPEPAASEAPMPLATA